MSNFTISNTNGDSVKINIKGLSGVEWNKILMETWAIYNKSYEGWCAYWNYDTQDNENKVFYDSLIKIIPDIIRVTGLTGEELLELQELAKSEKKDFNYFKETKWDKLFDNLVEKKLSKCEKKFNHQEA